MKSLKEHEGGFFFVIESVDSSIRRKKHMNFMAGKKLREISGYYNYKS
jgi:hypothetical protein